MGIDRDRILRTAEKLVSRERYKQAIEEYGKLLKDTPQDARILLKVGDLHARLDAYASAVDAYARAGRAYADDGFAAKAVAILKQVQQLIATRVPHLAEYYLYVYPMLAQLYQELRLPREAAAMFDAYAAILAREGRTREAATVLRAVVELGADNPLTRLRLAELLTQEGDGAGARDQFGMAADALIGMGRVDDALKVLERMLQQEQDATIARTAAQLYLQRGEPDDGKRALMRLQVCFTADPKDLETLGMLARAFEAINQKDRAFEVRKETVRIAREQGAIDIARTLARDLQREAPNDPAVQALLRALPPPPPVIPRRTQPSPAEASLPEVSVEIESVRPAAQVVTTEASRHVVDVTLDMPVIEETSTWTSVDASADVESALENAKAFREKGEVSRAVVAVRIGLELAPNSVRLRTLLKDLLLVEGKTDAAIEAMLDLGCLHRDAGRPLEACALFYDVLGIVPGHEEATELLKEVEPERGRTSQPVPMPVIEAEPISELEPIPSAPEIEISSGIPFTPSLETAIPAELLTNLQDDGVLSRKPLAGIKGFRGGDAVETALEEAEFFASRGLFEDAVAILQEQLERTPDIAPLQTRLTELEESLQEELSETQPSVLGIASPTLQAAQLAAGGDTDAIDSALAELEDSGSIAPPSSFDEAAVNVDSLFDAFKAGIAAQVGEGDNEMQYDLGVAYLEMGRFDDSIAAFEIAARDASRAIGSWSMIGTVHQRRGDLDSALHAFEVAQHCDGVTPDQALGILYEIGNVHEAKGDRARALVCFERIASQSRGFRDVVHRIDALRGKGTVRGRGGGRGDDDLERAFDELLTGADDDRGE